jgi:hypothetical protein
MRTLSTAGAAVIASGVVALAVLVEMDLTSPLNLNTTNLDLVISGTTYYGTRGLGQIDAVTETTADVRNIKFSLSGVPSSSIALALSEPVQGKAVRIKLAIYDPSTFAVLDVVPFWAGQLDVFGINDGDPVATINVTAEHAGIDLTRPSGSVYSNDEQQRLHPGDLFFQFLADQVEQKIVWPTAAFFRQ